MGIITLLTLFILGTILGSGLNAAAARLEEEESWTTGRSRCPHCAHGLRWWELLPLVSFVFLRRRCSRCHGLISWQYPLVELAAGGLLVLSYTTFGLTASGVVAVIAALLLLFIYIYDGRTMLIPNPAVWIFNALAFIALFINLQHPLAAAGNSLVITPTVWELAAGPLVALPLLLIWLASRGRAMGFGDVKLALGIGWLLGVTSGFSALIFAFWFGAAVSLGLLTAQWLWKSSSPKATDGHTMKSAQDIDRSRLTLKSAVPFGPFLVLGWLTVFFSNLTLF